MSSFEVTKFSQAVQKLLFKLGIRRTFDFVLHLPIRYDDETRITCIANTLPGVMALVAGMIIHREIKLRPRRQLILHISDGQETLIARFFHFYPKQVQEWQIGSHVYLFGEIKKNFFNYETIHPRCKLQNQAAPLPATLTPYYPSTNAFTQSQWRKWINQALNTSTIVDTLPAPILKKYAFLSFPESIYLLHQPPANTPINLLTDRSHPAWQRIKFDELLAQQLSMQAARDRRKKQQAPAFNSRGNYAASLINRLPFSLTAAQQKVFSEICADLKQDYPMQRLLQGDVGSGKTVVAALAALEAIESGFQVALMAPTEILAEQHYTKMTAWLAPLGIELAWLSGSLKKEAKLSAIESVAQGKTQLAIGTHALFQENVQFSNLGLAIIDEQHRFGVHQRLALQDKGVMPHQLMMSATPIPRTLAMTYYADLEVSIIDEIPPGRTPIITKLVAQERRAQVIALAAAQCALGRQVYWVCPLIEESEALQLQTVSEVHALLEKALPHLSVGLIHGKMKAADKTKVMLAFQQNHIQLLVATTVIEVGMDIPNATLIIIEHAERMGLSQLHQLRGRVGRGVEKSACILLYKSPLSDNGKFRLKTMLSQSDGFAIAQYDLKLRGPGELLGSRQSGMPLLRFADLDEDVALLDTARELAPEFLINDPIAAQAHMDRWLKESIPLLGV